MEEFAAGMEVSVLFSADTSEHPMPIFDGRKSEFDETGVSIGEEVTRTALWGRSRSIRLRLGLIWSAQSGRWSLQGEGEELMVRVQGRVEGLGRSR